MRFVFGRRSRDTGEGLEPYRFDLIDLEHLERGVAAFHSLDSAKYAAEEANRNPDWIDELMWARDA